MLGELDKTITKVVVNQLKHQTTIPQPMPIPNHQLSSKMKGHLQRQAILFIRNSLRCILRKHLRKVLSRLVIRRTCWRLIASKRKRDMEDAFLLLRRCHSQTTLMTITTFYNRLPELTIVDAICKKILVKPERQALDKIRACSLKRSRVKSFVVMLAARWNESMWREGGRKCWLGLLEVVVRQRQRELATQQIVTWVKYRRTRLLRNNLTEIVQFYPFTTCLGIMQEWKTKKQKIVSNQENRKETLAKLREDLKKLKPLLDQQKMQKHKLLGQLKKKMNDNKVQLRDTVREHEKEMKWEQQEVEGITDELEEWERVRTTRRDIVQCGNSSQNSCNRIYQLTSEQDSEFRGIEQIVPNVEKEVFQFKQSANYYFLSNLYMDKLIEIYEKRQIYNYQAEYYEIEYENKVVRETMRCFVRQKYEGQLNKQRQAIREQRSMTSLHLSCLDS